MLPVAAVVLAGGRATRFGGADKPAATVAGVPLLTRVLTAVAGCAPRIVVGPPRPDLPPDVRGVQETPPGGGPVAALAAALPLVDTGVVALLAADLPALTPATVEALIAAVGAADGALLVDPAGRRQLLCGAWRAASLRSALRELGDPTDQSLRRLVSPLTVNPVTLPDGSRLPPWFDVDTPADLAAARRAADEGE